MTPTRHDASSIRDVQAALAAWFTTHARDLPWRSPDTTAWGVLVSEVMLQQTPAARVVGPWTNWMARWPTPAHLAEAATGDVLKQWDRLGYPRRALRLQQAAVAIIRDHGGDVPEDEDSLRSLPGVGSYTAAAVLAFAHRRRSLVLDVNVRRVLARLDGGVEHPARHETASERDRAWHWIPRTIPTPPSGRPRPWSSARRSAPHATPAAASAPSPSTAPGLRWGDRHGRGRHASGRRGTGPIGSAGAGSWLRCGRRPRPSR